MQPEGKCLNSNFFLNIDTELCLQQIIQFFQKVNSFWVMRPLLYFCSNMSPLDWRNVYSILWMAKVKVKVNSFSHVQFFVTPWTVAYQAPPSMGFSRQEYWSGLPFSFSRGSSRPSDQTLVSRILGRCFNLWATREAQLRLFKLRPSVVITVKTLEIRKETYIWRF